MDPEIKKNLMRLYLQTLYAEEFEESWLDDMERSELLDRTIEYINENSLNLNELTPGDPKFKIFVVLAKQAVEFNDETPPAIVVYDEDALDDEIQLWASLRNADYISRKTNPQPISADEELNKLKEQAYEVLLETTKTILPNADISTPKKLKEAIDWFEKKYKEENSEEKAKCKSILSLLKNIDKISKLEIIDIPNEQGEPVQFCTMAESAGGVTAKISVTPREVVLEKLQNIVAKGTDLNFTDFRQHTRDYELKTQGILKLPKHGETIEVQREAIALNIARILGFTTTQSTMVNHKGKVALYVPFDDIQLMKEFAQGETQRIIVPSGITKIGTIGDPYLHHSTITPVGNGLHCDTTLHDFGHKVGFSFLCNDTDFIGAYNQNKAIIGGKELYIFDQVVMSSDKMDFDTRLSMVPIGVKRHSRHNQGRNRSLVEDSSFDTKFDGIVHLINNQERINVMLDNIIGTHTANLVSTQEKINQLERLKLERGSLKREENEQLTSLKSQKSELIKLKVDAETIKETINNRFVTMFKNFPIINGKPMTGERFITHQNEIKPALELEKLANNPVLFSDDGRPYRNPWTTRNTIRITAIEEHGNDMHLTFNECNRSHLINILESAGVESCEFNGNTLIISKEELQKINENSIYPERAPFSMDTDYLNMNDIKRMSAGYSGSNLKFATKLIEHYQTRIQMAEEDPSKKVEAMYDTLHAIKGNSGFEKHLQLKLQLDIQQKLRPIILDLITEKELQEGMEDKLAKAYEAAVKLDRVNYFNHVLMRFVTNPVNTNQKALDEYLERCIQHGDLATDYNTAKTESKAMGKESKLAYELIPTRVHNSMQKLGVPVLDQDWQTKDPLKSEEEQLDKEKEKIVDMNLSEEQIIENNPSQITPPEITIKFN
ncbi:coiled-coil protein [Legionella gratiana]|uniref:Coiled-coil protein n=1 Tax=Legionella gratiana TaxID=45066 RepID=A0A378JG79_9GAMM|nr:hypothetical protein [Legionella gratiana]KTD10677.1 coiled-coil protein [Legionella gratiana]STX43680.1 coiled-coil protein [Legionella gratiana]